MENKKVPIKFIGNISEELKKEISEETQKRFGSFTDELIEKNEEIEISSEGKPYDFVVIFDNIKDEDLRTRLQLRMESKA